jgi:hypothetical protein
MPVDTSLADRVTVSRSTTAAKELTTNLLPQD